MSGITNNTNFTNQINPMSGIPNNQMNLMSGNPISTTPVQQPKKTSPMLLFGGFVLVLVVVGGAAYYYYNQMTITESIQPKQKIENSDDVQYSVPVKKKKLKTAKKTKLYETEEVELNPVSSAHVTNFLDMDAIKAKEIIENQYSYKINEVVILPLHSMVTKDYREDRVRLYVNYKNLVKKIEAPGLPDIEGRSLPSNLDVIEEDYYSTESINEVVDEFVETDVVSQNIVVYETEVEPNEEVVVEPEVIEPDEEVIETENVSQNIVSYETEVEPIEEVVFEPEVIEPEEEVIETENVSQNIVVYETVVEPIEEEVVEPEPIEEVEETDVVSQNSAVYETEVEPDVQVVFEPTVIEPEEEVIETDVVSQNIVVYETEVEPIEEEVVEPEPIEEVEETNVVSQNSAVYETEIEPIEEEVIITQPVTTTPVTATPVLETTPVLTKETVINSGQEYQIKCKWFQTRIGQPLEKKTAFVTCKNGNPVGSVPNNNCKSQCKLSERVQGYETEVEPVVQVVVPNVLTPEEEVINSGEVYEVYCSEWGGPVDCKNGQVTNNLTVCNSDCSNPSMVCPYENSWGKQC